MSKAGLKQGDKITCKACKKVVLIAAVDIPPKALMKSEYLLWYDGSPVEFKAECVCPHCWIRFSSISTKLAETILNFPDLDIFP